MATQELKYVFKVSEEGVITVINRKQWEKDMVSLFKGKQVVGLFRKPKKIRSTKLNSFYWGISIPEIIEGLVNNGFDRHTLTVEIVHDMLRHKFLTVDMPSTEFAGEYITITRSSTDLTNGEWLDYMVDVERWCSEFLGIILSKPNEQKEIDLL